MQPRYASNSSEAGDEHETWSSSSVTIPPITGFHSQIHPPHYHHFHGPPVRPASPQPTGPPSVQNPARDPHPHHHSKYRSSNEWKKLKDNSPHCHLPLNENQKLSPCKTLGIDLYEVEDSQLGNHITNSHARGHSAGIPDLPPFQRRCIHVLADIITSPYTLGLPAQIGVFLRPDHTRRSAFNKQLSTYLKTAYRRLGKKPKDLHQKWDILATLLPTLFVLSFSYFCGLIFGWRLGQTIGLTSIILYFLFLCIVLYGGLKKRWKLIQPVAETLLRYARSWRLIVDIIFYKPQKQTTIPSNIRLLPVSLKLGASESSWDAALRLSEKMWQSATSKYSKTTVYLQYASEDGDCTDSWTITPAKSAVERRCRKSCCLPAWVCAFLGVISLPTLFTALQIYMDLGNNPAHYKLGSKVAFISAAIIEIIVIVSLAVTAYKPIIRLAKVKSDTKISLLSADDDLMEDRSSSSIDSMTGRINHSRNLQAPKTLTSPKQAQDYLPRNGFDSLEKSEGIDAQLESRLREEAMATCYTLHRLDARNDRQTRFLLSIDATAISVNLTTATQRLAEFSGLLNRLFTLSPQGESGVLWSLDDAKELTEPTDSVHSKRLKESVPNVPNVIILLVCRQNMSPPSDSGPESRPICDFWQNALDACHLTVFIDEPTEGPPQTPGGNNSHVESRHSTKTNHCTDSSCPSDVWPSSLSFPDFFVEEHPLADINFSKLKHLLIHMAFLGRMLKAGKNRGNWYNLLEVATTWLCLLVHWPFHSAWLSLFLEEHYLSGGAGQAVRQRIRIPGIIGSGGDSSDDDDENTASTTSQPVLPEDTLPMLYSRVLERLAPALSACRSRGGTLPSQVQSPASHRSHSSSGGWQTTGSGFQTSAALRLSELASRDCGPARLAALLRYRSRARNVNPTISAARPNISVRHLVAVMASSPLMNPKTRARIQAFLNRRGFSLIRSSSRDLQVHRSLQSLRDRELELLPIPINPPKTVRPCPVRLKNGVPRKPLSKMTVNDVCRLVDDMIDLYSNHCHYRPRTNSESTSDTLNDDNRRQTTPQSISRSTSIAAYFLRLRALNISGAVLTVCSLNESLRREIGMTFGDWQLFTNLINHLKMLESENISNPPTPQHNCQCARSMGDLASIHHTHWHHTHPTQHGSSKLNHNTWTSESILGAATQWRHGNDSSPSPINDGSSASSSIMSGSCTSADPNWRSHALSIQEETCHLSGGSCSVYSAELSCSISSSEDTIPSNASSPSLSSLHSSTLHDDALSQDKTPNKHWRYDVNV